MKKILLTALVILLIACDTSDPEIPVSSRQLKKRMALLKSYGLNDFFVSDSIIETYSNNVISRSDIYVRQYGQPYKAIFVSYEFDQNQILIKRNFYTDRDMTNLYSTVSYSYNDDQSIKSIVSEKFKASNLSDNLYHVTDSFEYKGDTVKTFRINHKDNNRKIEKPTYVIYGNLDSIKSVEVTYMYRFDEDSDLYQREYLGEPQDVWSWQTDIDYGNERIPVLHNFFGTKLNLFLVPEPIPYLALELTSKFREFEFIHTHRTNENIIYNYMVDADQRPIEFVRSGTYYPGDAIKYYFE